MKKGMDMDGSLWRSFSLSQHLWRSLPTERFSRSETEGLAGIQ